MPQSSPQNATGLESLLAYTLHLADNALVLGHRNSEWCGHGPVLEQDIAITNISLDLIGQARNFYQYAASLKNDGSTEDHFAYWRQAGDFNNLVLAELPRGDWAITTLRQFFFSAYQQLVFDRLAIGRDKQLAAIAAKSIKETAYHLRWSSEWVIRLGDATEESHERINKAVSELWPYTGEFFEPAGYQTKMANQGIAPDVSLLRKSWTDSVSEVFREAGLSIPTLPLLGYEGKRGIHSGHLAGLLKELQSVARAFPGASW